MPKQGREGSSVPQHDVFFCYIVVSENPSSRGAGATPHHQQPISDPRGGSSPPCIPIQLGLAYTQHRPKSCTHELEDGRGKHGQAHSIHAPRDFNNPFRVLTLTLINKEINLTKRVFKDVGEFKDVGYLRMLCI